MRSIAQEEIVDMAILRRTYNSNIVLQGMTVKVKESLAAQLICDPKLRKRIRDQQLMVLEKFRKGQYQGSTLKK